MRGNSLIENRSPYGFLRRGNSRRTENLKYIKSTYRRLKGVTRWVGIPAHRVIPLSVLYISSHLELSNPLSDHARLPEFVPSHSVVVSC